MYLACKALTTNASHGRCRSASGRCFNSEKMKSRPDSVSRTERYRPLVEDVIDAIAVLDESPEFDRKALNRFIGLAIPVVAFVVIQLICMAAALLGILRLSLYEPAMVFRA